jgi:hypothetical protein
MDSLSAGTRQDSCPRGRVPADENPVIGSNRPSFVLLTFLVKYLVEMGIRKTANHERTLPCPFPPPSPETSVSISSPEAWNWDFSLFYAFLRPLESSTVALEKNSRIMYDM